MALDRRPTGDAIIAQAPQAPGEDRTLARLLAACSMADMSDSAHVIKPAGGKTTYASDGYAIAPVFAPQEVEAAQADIIEQLDRVASALHHPFEHSCPDLPLTERLDAVAGKEKAYANLLRLAVLTDAHRGPRLTQLAQNPKLRAVAEQLAGRPLQAAGNTIRLRASFAAFPEHWHNWHSDVAIHDGSDCGRLNITAWIPLMDAGPGQGGLEIAAGRQSAPLPHVRASDFHIEPADLDHLPRATPHCRAGEVLFLDRFTPHRTLPNAGTARFALVVWMKAA